MKRMIMAAAALLFTATLASAQMRPTIKVEAAANFANVSTKTANVENTKTGDMIIGARAGVGAEFAITREFYINPSLQFVMRGTKSSATMAGITGTATSRYNVLEVPVHAGYRFGFAPNMAVSLQAGPYFAYTLTGKAKSSVEVAGKQLEKEFDIFAEGSKAKRFDVGVGMQAAFEYSRYYLMLGYEQGLLNQSGLESTTLNHMNFYVGAGVRF